MRVFVLGLLFLFILGLSHPTSVQSVQSDETVVTDQVGTLGAFGLFKQQLSDSLDDTCLAVLPLEKIDDQPIGEGDMICDISLKQAESLDIFEGEAPGALWKSWNIRVVLPGILPDRHCLVTTPVTPGPKPLIHCSF